MSELINNREYRKEVLKSIIKDLHDGKNADEVQARFAELIKEVSAKEISEMEQALIMEGMEIEEIQRLCDVHAAVFKGSITEVHHPESPEKTPGHPVHTFLRENRALEEFMESTIQPLAERLKSEQSEALLMDLQDQLERLWEIDLHYSRKENLLFPYLEKYEITAPPKVMWGVDDENRERIKELRKLLQNFSNEWDQLFSKIDELIYHIKEMIFKEENILFPMALETLTEDEWFQIAEESHEIGFCLTEPLAKWEPNTTASYEEDKQEAEELKQKVDEGFVSFESGVLSFQQIETLFNHLPIDITFIDDQDTVKYFSLGKERIFTRTKAAIGRDVHNCHPPASVHIVDQILQDFKSGKKDSEDFWIQMGEIFAYIRYFAVRDKSGKYMGTLEVTQNIKPIQALSGEKRLLD